MSVDKGVPQPQQQRHGMRGGLWWSSLQLTSLLEQNDNGRLQMWKGPRGLEFHISPHHNITPEWMEKKNGRLLLALIHHLDVLCLILHRKHGKYGGNDLYVISVVHL